MTRERLSIILLLSSLILTLAVPFIGGSLVQNYSHFENYISELGAVGTQFGTTISLGGFLPIGLLVICFLIVSKPLVNFTGIAKVGYYFLFFIGLSYIGAAFAPCDMGCPAEGTVRQSIHNSLGVFEYIGGGIGLLMLATSTHYQHGHSRYKFTLLFSGAIVLIAFIAMASPELAVWRGLFQRIAEASLFGSLIVVNRTPTIIR